MMEKVHFLDVAIHLANGIGEDYKKTKFSQLSDNIKKIYTDCKKSVDKAYKALIEMFAGTPIGKKIKEIWNSEKKVWVEFKNDAIKYDEFTE